jgi:HK97 family phage major capsid protein
VAKIAELTTELHTHLKTARDIAEKAETEGRDFTAEERQAVTDALEKAKPVKAALLQAKADNEMVAALADMAGVVGIDPPSDRREPKGYDDPRTARKSVGEVFVGSDQFKALLKQWPNGQVPEKARIQSDPVGFKTLVTGASDTSAGAFVLNDRTDIVEMLGRRPLTVRNAISVRQTTSDLIEYVRQTSRVNAAATVAEATAVSGTSGTKPEGGFALQVVQTAVTTMAEWIPATRRALSDASQLRGLIDQELLDDLAQLEEDQIVSGDGTGSNLTGILNTSGIQAQAYDTDLFTTTRKARTLVRTVGRSVPTAYMLNPADWQTIDLSQDANLRYYGAGPFAMSTPTLWGLPVIESEAIPAGVGLVGDFRKCVLWDREQASILVSDSHADFFVRNMIAVLAEDRMAFGVTRPSAIVQIDLTP